VVGRTQEAEIILLKTMTINYCKAYDFELSDTKDSLDTTSQKDQSNIELFRVLLDKDNIPLWTVWYCFGFCYYGVILFVARVFEGNSESHTDTNICNYNYQAIFTTAFSEVFGTIFTLYSIDKWGRIKTQIFLYSLAGVSVFLMGLDLGTSFISVTAMIARSSASAASMSTWVATPELVPTKCRGTAHSVANSIARVGAFIAPFVVEGDKVSKVNVGAILGVVNALATSAVCFLPETAGSVHIFNYYCNIYY
jgi:MFS family permease